MSKFHKFLLAIIGLLLIVIVALLCFILGSVYGQNKAAQTKLTSQSIYEKINNEAVLQTKSVYINQISKITVDNGSEWSNFWWGQTIDAESLMKINVGVDLQQVKATDISVDMTNKKIFITLPNAKVLEALPQGDIKATTKNGVLRTLLANDPNKDYNQAVTQLKADATAAVNATPQIITDARTDTGAIISVLLKDTGYTVTIL